MFKFDFGGDSESSNNDANQVKNDSELLPAQLCSLQLLADRAPRISYTKDSYGIPRRDLFDVRYESMSADDMSEEEKSLLSGAEDVRKTVYEGGLKVWEGTNDLLDIITQKSDIIKEAPTNCIELGCGAGLPICYLFHQAIEQGRSGKFVLADYNSAVLRSSTMPNLVLSWLAATKNELVTEDHGELAITPEIIESLQADSNARSVDVQFVAGAWSAAFSELVGNGTYDLVLASETIYSLDSIKEFTSVLQNSLKSNTGIGLVAAKKVYFGVGGGIVEFELLLDERKMPHQIVYEKGNVGRVVLQVMAPSS